MKSHVLELTLASSVVLALAWGCSARSDDCAELRTCATDGGGAGASGSSGKGGATGKGGAGGGTSSGGDGGEGNEGQAGQGTAGSGGEAGAGAGCNRDAHPSDEP